MFQHVPFIKLNSIKLIVHVTLDINVDNSTVIQQFNKKKWTDSLQLCFMRPHYEWKFTQEYFYLFKILNEFLLINGYVKQFVKYMG